METLLVHAGIAERVLPELAAQYQAAGVELRGCERSRALLDGIGEATETDWAEEYLAPELGDGQRLHPVRRRLRVRPGRGDRHLHGQAPRPRAGGPGRAHQPEVGGARGRACSDVIPRPTFL